MPLVLLSSARGAVAGPLGWFAKAARAIGEWLFADWRNGLLLVFALGLFAHVFILTPELRGDRDKAEQAAAAAAIALTAERAAHRQTVADAQAAAKWAQDAAEANARRVAAEQARATERIVDDFQNDIAVARALAARLGRLSEGQAAPADPCRSGSAGVPGPAAAARRTGEAPGETGLSGPGVSAAAITAPMSVAARLTATEQAIQLDKLIDWVLAITAIPTAPPIAALSTREPTR